MKVLLHNQNTTITLVIASDGDHVLMEPLLAGLIFLDLPLRPGNIGDPSVRDILIQEAMNFFWDPDIETVLYDRQHPPAQREPGKAYYTGGTPLNKPKTCPVCQGVLPGAMIEIRNNIIKRAWIYTPGEFDPWTDHYIIAPDGTLIPKKEWNDHPMTRRESC